MDDEMIFERPLIRTTGSQGILIEFGDELSFLLNLRCLSFAKEVNEQRLNGIVDVIPSYSTVLLCYDDKIVSRHALLDYCDEVLSNLPTPETITLPSRVIEIAVAYNDRWSKECVADYCRKIKEVDNNAEFVAKVNGLADVDELIRLHTGTQWWVGHIGFIAGLGVMMPLDPTYKLSAPRYDPPRLWTPQGTVALGGAFTAIYPMVTPDGYQILGRTPVPVYDPQLCLPGFEGSHFLLRLGDRVCFKSISEEQFIEIEQAVVDGKYEIPIFADGVYGLKRYQNGSNSKQDSPHSASTISPVSGGSR